MRLRIILQYSSQKTENIIIFWSPNQTVGDLCAYLEKNCHINAPSISIEGFRALDDQYVQNLLNPNDVIIQAIENQGSNLKKDQKAIKTCVKQFDRVKPVNQPESNDESVSPPKIIKPQQKGENKITQNQKPTKLQSKPEQPPIQKKVVVQPNKPIINYIQSETESSSEDVLIKKPSQANKLLISQISPEEELKIKQTEWKKTFTKGMQDSSVQKQNSQKASLVKPKQLTNTQQVVQQQTNKPNKEQQAVKITQTASIILNEFVKIQVKILKEDPNILEKDDEILFKYVYLDLIKCEPTVSEQLLGKILENNSQEKQLTIQSREKLTISFSELQDVEINISKLSEARKAVIKMFAVENPQPQVQQKQSEILDCSTKLDSNQKEVIDPFGIGQQINYYYSEKNYNKDDFILQHSAQDPEKYMNFKLLLNFPKIKSKIKTVEDLKDIVDLFLSKTSSDLVNFQIKQNSDGNWAIRKKIQ